MPSIFRPSTAPALSARRGVAYLPSTQSDAWSMRYVALQTAAVCPNIIQAFDHRGAKKANQLKGAALCGLVSPFQPSAAIARSATLLPGQITYPGFGSAVTAVHLLCSRMERLLFISQ